MKDLMVGCATNYDWSKLKYWVNSINASGFEGDKVLILMNCDKDTAQKVTDAGFSIIAFNQDAEGNLTYQSQLMVHVERFIHIHKLLKDNLYRYVITTDVKDVIFQKNPSEWLEKNLGDKTINVASESIRYKDEPWGKNNLTLSFGPLIYEANQNNLVYNAGTVSGKLDTMLDLFLNLYMSCGGAPQNVPGGGGPDQAALNVLLNTVTYKNTTRFTKSEEGWAAQLGTTADPSKLDSFKPFLDEPSPIMKDGLVCTSKGEPFYLVHQYDRVPEWKDIIEKKYA